MFSLVLRCHPVKLSFTLSSCIAWFYDESQTTGAPAAAVASSTSVTKRMALRESVDLPESAEHPPELGMTKPSSVQASTRLS